MYTIGFLGTRNNRIIHDVAAKIEEDKHPLVLTERREHTELLNQLLTEKGYQTVVLRGAMRAKELKKANEQLAEAQAIVATGKYTLGAEECTNRPFQPIEYK